MSLPYMAKYTSRRVMVNRDLKGGKKLDTKYWGSPSTPPLDVVVGRV